MLKTGSRYRTIALWSLLILTAAAPTIAQPVTSTGAPADGLRVVEIEIQGMKFSESAIEVPVGTTVRWVNRDPVVHTTTEDGDRPMWQSSSLGPGDVFEVTFEAPGEYTYHCVLHPFMIGTIVVGRSDKEVTNRVKVRPSVR